jgi:AAA15 family ATPase/GTPase
MLIEFKVENFRSFREEQTLSFIGSNSDSELPDNYVTPELPKMPGVRLLKVAAIYGPNASGKSNIIKALRYFAAFAANSFTDLKPEAATGTVPFRFDEEWSKRPSLFEVSFVHKAVRYTYGLALTPERVTEEYLVAYPNEKKQVWFEREWMEATKEYRWSPPTENFPNYDTHKLGARPNCTFLSGGAQLQHPKLSIVREWFVDHFVPAGFDSVIESPDVTAHWYYNHPEHREGTVRVLKDADLGIVNFRIEKLPDGVRPEYKQTIDEWNYRIQFLHKGKDNAWLNFSEESEGTQRFFALFVPWVLALITGDFICIDEIEASLHPFLARKLIELYLSPGANKNGAQLLFTTHNTFLLDQELLRRDQFWFTEKDDRGATHLYPLTDYSPRKKEALSKGYLSGRYGALPFIPERLIPPQ